jgi:hypothetical protein
VVVDLDHAALGQLDAAVVGQQAGGGGAAADGDQQLVDDQRWSRLAVVVGEVDLAVLDLGLGDLAAES